MNENHGRNRAPESVLEQIAVEDVQRGLEAEMKQGLAEAINIASPSFIESVKFMLYVFYKMFKRN